MVCLGFEPGATGWKGQMNPLSYGGTRGGEIVYSSFTQRIRVQIPLKLSAIYAKCSFEKAKMRR